MNEEGKEEAQAVQEPEHSELIQITISGTPVNIANFLDLIQTRMPNVPNGANQNPLLIGAEGTMVYLSP